MCTTTHPTLPTPPRAASRETPKGTLRQRLFAYLLSLSNAPYESAMADRKRALFGGLSGTVVEIGPGAGGNLRYFDPNVQWIGIEPNPYAHPRLREEAARLGLSVDLRAGTAAATGLADGSADAVVSTLVLCSVPDLEDALREVLRVLKPGGRFAFIEHVAAPAGTGRRRLQDLLRPVWNAVADGCHPNRETSVAVERAGFDGLYIEHFEAPAAGVARPHIAGYATKKGCRERP